MRTVSKVLLIVASLVSFSAVAEDHRERSHWHGDIRFFHEHDHVLWRSGHWFHGPHAGKSGWWWIVSGVWYYYPRRIAVIPDPYVPPTVSAPPVTASPPPVVASATPGSWYYCNNPHGYYPYVTSCQENWVMVPATPPPPPPGQ